MHEFQVLLKNKKKKKTPPKLENLSKSLINFNSLPKLRFNGLPNLGD